MTLHQFGFSDFDGPDAAAFQAEREARISLLKMLTDAGVYSIHGQNVADGMAGEIGGHWQPYCVIHDLAYAHGGFCPDCIVGVPHIEFQGAHTDYGRSVVRNAMAQRAWRQQRDAHHAAKERTGHAGTLSRLRGGWLRQRRLERQRVAEETPVCTEPIFPTKEPGRKRRRGRRGGRHHLSVGLVTFALFLCMILLGLAMRIATARFDRAYPDLAAPEVRR